MVYNRAQRTMRRKLLLWVAVLLLANVALAQTHDFSAVAPSGQTLYYKIVDGEAHVVKPYGSYNSSDMQGDLSIPQSVSHNGTTYTVSAIGSGAFSYCGYITSVVIPNTVRIIGEEAFYSCGMNTVSIPGSVTKIRDEAFSWCHSLTSVVIPNSVDSLGERVFYVCRNLISAIIGNGVTTISRSAFSECYNLTSVTIPASVTLIDRWAFSSCRALTTIDIPNSVATIGELAFSDCRNLASVVIPSSVTSIGGSAFSGCDNITSIAVAQGNTVYDSRNDCNALIETATNTLIKGCVNTVIPGTITSIGESAFSGCSGLTSVTLPNGLTSIGRHAFFRCSGLTSVTLSNGLASIGSYAFYGCSGLTSITLPGTLTTIEGSAFRDCSGLTSVILPASVTSIPHDYDLGTNPFRGCNNLTSIVVEPGNTKYDSRGNCNAIIETATNTLLAGCKNTTIPGNVAKIGPSAFWGQAELRTTIPASVSQISRYAFGYSGTIIVPNTVTAIGGDAFYRANNVVYSSTLEGAPWGAKTLNGYVENGLIYTDNSKTVLTGFEGNLGAVDIPASVDTIGEWALAYSSLTSVTIPRSVKWIGHSALNNCNRLQTVTLNADSCYYSGGIWLQGGVDLLSGCPSFKLFVIGDRVASIPGGTIENTSTLDTIISFAETPPTFVPMGSLRSEIVMKVPCTALDAYRNTEPWSRLNLYCETEGIEDALDEAYEVYVSEGKIVVEGAVQEVVSVYDVMGRMVHRWRGDGTRRVKKGLYLVRIGESSARKVVVM